MSDCIDIEARGQVGELRADLTSLATDYWGKDGTNGHRSRSVLAQKRLAEIERNFDHYIDKVREETCIGLAGLKKHEVEHDKRLAQAIAEHLLKIQLEAEKGKGKVQRLQAVGPWVTAGAAVLIAFRDIILGAIK